MNQETHIYLLLNPSEQRDLYRSPVNWNNMQPVNTLEKFKAEHADWEERENAYQEWLQNRSEDYS